MKFKTGIDRKFYQLERENRWIEQEHKCLYCNEIIPRDKITADHVKPLKDVKNHISSNIVAACEKCNKLKSSLSIEEFNQLRNKNVPNELKEFFDKLEQRVRLAEYKLDVTTHFTKFRLWHDYWNKRKRWRKF